MDSVVNVAWSCDQTDVKGVFYALATQLDSSLHESIESKLKEIRLFNGFLKILNAEELIPVGSSMDGSKVNTPGDYGDVDILLVPKKIVLNESLFDYLPRYPAFLFLRGDREYRQYFNDVNLIDGRYVPVKVLKQMHKRSFKQIRMFVCGTTNVSRPFSNDCFSAVKRTGVGYENTRLDASSLEMDSDDSELESNVPKPVELIGKFLNSALDKMTDFKASVDGCHKKKPRRKSESQSSVARDYVNAASKVLELFTGSSDSDSDDEEVTTSKTKSTSQTKSQETEVFFSYDSDDDEVRVTYENNFDVEEETSDNVTDDEENEDEMSDIQTVHRNDDGCDRTVAMPKISSADLVPAFKYEGWPRTAQEWLQRERKWPGEDVVQQVREAGCHIVAKRPLLPECNGDPNNEDNSSAGDAVNRFFRLSFSKCELQLANSLSDPQKLCWRILKAYQKGFLGTKPKVLASYHWKNALFWVLEETDTAFWTNDNVFDGVCLALQFMIRCLENKCVPLYFVRTENLIDGCREDMIALAKERVIEIRQNPLLYLQFFIEKPPEAEPFEIKASALDECRLNAKRKSYFMIDTVAEFLDKDNLRNLSVQSFEGVHDFFSVLKSEVERRDGKAPEFFDRFEDCTKLVVDKTCGNPDRHDIECNCQTCKESLHQVLAATGKAATSLVTFEMGGTKAAFTTGALEVAGNTFSRAVQDKTFDGKVVCGGVLKTFGSTFEASAKTQNGADALIGKGISALLEVTSDLLVQDGRKDKKKSQMDTSSVLKSLVKSFKKKL